MLYLLVCYVTTFILVTIITLTYDRRASFLASLLGLLFYGAVYYLRMGRLLDINFTLAALLLIAIALLGGYFMGILKEQRDALYKENVRAKQLEKDLLLFKEQNLFFKENAPDIIYRIAIQPDFSFEYLSPQVESITGYSPQYFYRDPRLFVDRIHPEDRSIFYNIIGDHSSLHERAVIRLIAEEEDIYLELHHFPSYGSKGELLFIEGIARDVTKSVLTKKSLQFTKERLQLTLESMGEGLITTDSHGRISLINDEGSRLTGWPKNRAVGSFLEQVFCLFDEHGQVKSSELNLERPLLLFSHDTKEKRLITGFQSPLGEEEEGMVYLFRDTTKQWQIERERNQLLNELKQKVKELQIIHDILHLLQDDEKKMEEILQELVEKIPSAMKRPWIIGARIIYGEEVYCSSESLSLKSCCSEPLLDGGQLEIYTTEDSDAYTLQFQERKTLRALAEVTGLFLKKKRDLLEKRGVESKLKEHSLRLASILDASPAAIITQNLEGRITSWNRAAEEIFGYKKEEIIDRSLPLLPEGYREQNGCYFQQILKGESIRGIEVKRSRKDGSYIDINLSAIPLTNGEGEVIGALSIILDMTEEKQAKEKIISLHHQDPLTGLYNRAFMEKEIEALEMMEILPISVILMDINGLKIINEAFGRHEGNRILMSVARSLQRESREEDLIGRWGPDEFLLLLPKVSKDELEIISQRVLSTDLPFMAPIPISFSINTATREDVTISLEELICSVEDDLYEENQDQIQAARDTILCSMLKMLTQVSDETDEHTWLMQSLAMEMGEMLHLSEIELEELSLLVPLHDIGKITIDKEILLKEEVLSKGEWEQVKTHSEAGCYIAQSSEAFSHMATAIKAHHERWDGLGYPDGLKGGEIPLISRILAIVDAFDTMTKKRKYGERLTSEEALNEMKKNGGRQFDPNLLEVFVSCIEKKESEHVMKGSRVSLSPISARQQLNSSFFQIQALSRRLLHAQEEEMARLARDLHDDIGQNMTALKLDLELLGTEIESSNSQLKKRLRATINLVDSLIEHIRNQASALRPPVLDDIGLLAAITGIIDRYQRSTKIEFHLYQEDMEERFPRDVETVLYRCIQESLTNVVRHSKAQQVEIDLTHDCSEITVLIRDDGCGFELENLEISSDHIGLTGMKERVQLIHGRIYISSKPGIGTEIYISVPIL